jgi:dipeptidase E
MKNIIIASTSTLHGSDYLEYLLPVKIHLKLHNGTFHTRKT